MRTFVLLAALGLVAADVSPGKQGECLVDSGEAVSDATDAALFIWAAAKRCGKVGMVVKCTVDVTSAVKSVNSMINVILNAVDKCDGLHTANKECGLQASAFTKHTEALAASAAMIYQKCPHANQPNPPAAMGDIAAPVMCTIDLKDTLKQMFHMIKSIRGIHDDCDSHDKRDCAAGAMDIVSSIAGMGGYLAGAVGQCRRTDPKVKDKDTKVELCAQASNDLVHHTMEVAEAGTRLAQACEAPKVHKKEGPPKPKLTTIVDIQMPRLYEENGQTMANSSFNLILGAFLPVTAIVGFVGGRAYANRRGLEEAREVMSDHE